MYSKSKQRISKSDIQKLVSQRTARTLSKKEELLVEKTILKTRGSDEMISLHEIDAALKQLEQSRQIDKFDRSGVMSALEKRFN